MQYRDWPDSRIKEKMDPFEVEISTEKSGSG